MNSPEIQEFIKEQSHLFWYIPEKEKANISHEVLVEFIFNYGDIDAVKKLINLLGLKKTAEIFFQTISLSERRKGNFHELTLNFFSIFFSKYAP
jgi:hypothetical protein